MKALTKKQTVFLLLCAIILQIGLLVGKYLNSVYPLYLGKEVKLAIIPVDPRSLFRGQFVRLNYEISQVKPSLLKAGSGPYLDGREIYVILQKKGEHWVIDGVSPTKPEGGTFIRGRVHKNWRAIRVKYGIEAYFAAPKRAKKLEDEFRTAARGVRRGSNSFAGTATVRIAPNGKAALVGIEVS